MIFLIRWFHARPVKRVDSKMAKLYIAIRGTLVMNTQVSIDQIKPATSEFANRVTCARVC